MTDSQSDVGGPEDRGLLSQVGPMLVDWPRSAGYFGGIGLALAFDLINPPLALFIASIPFLKMLNRPGAAKPVRVLSQFFDGMAKPVGGDGTSTVKLTMSESVKPGPRGSRRPTRRPRVIAAPSETTSPPSAATARARRPRRPRPAE